MKWLTGVCAMFALILACTVTAEENDTPVNNGVVAEAGSLVPVPDQIGTTVYVPTMAMPDYCSELGMDIELSRLNIMILVSEWDELSEQLADANAELAIALLLPEGEAKTLQVAYLTGQIAGLQSAISAKYAEYDAAMDEQEAMVADYEEVPCSPALDPFDPMG